MNKNFIKLSKNLWESLVMISLLVLILALLLEFIIPVDAEILSLLRIFEVFALSFLFVELLDGFLRAENKIDFIKKDWVLILSFLPFGAGLRILRALRPLGAILRRERKDKEKTQKAQKKH